MTFSEIIGLLEDLTSTTSTVSSSYPLVKKTRDVNLALSEFHMISVQNGGPRQPDDTNHTFMPEIYVDMVSGREDYEITLDEDGVQILDIYRVEAKDNNGNWKLLQPYNEMQETTALEAQSLQSGTPTRYRVAGNIIYLDKKPSYNSTEGLKVYISRSPHYFQSTDTTEKPGIPEMFHRYLAIHPAYFYATRKGEVNVAASYLKEKNSIEDSIVVYYNNRNRDEKLSFKPRYTNYE